MDCSIEDTIYRDSSENESDLETNDLENELYSVIHYNDLSKGVPEHLTEKYDIEFNSDNEIVVSLKSGNEDNLKQEVSQVEVEPIIESEKQNSLSTNESDSEDSIVLLDKERSDVILISSSSSDEVEVINRPRMENRKKLKRNKVRFNRDKEDSLMVNFTGVAHWEAPMQVQVSDIIQNPPKWEDVVSPQNWTKEMRQYYNQPSPQLRNFNHRDILRDMKHLKRDERNPWKIFYDDIDPPRRHLKRCQNCRQLGHIFKDCPKRFSNCVMCGDGGHTDNYCPKKMCLNCGDRTGVFVDMCGRCVGFSRSQCFNCHRIGHEARTCPDNWRRFHSTIAGPIKSESDKNPIQYCCNCASYGHLDEDCKISFQNTFPKMSLFVKEYSDNHVVNKRPPAQSTPFHNYHNNWSPVGQNKFPKKSPKRKRKRTNEFTESFQNNDFPTRKKKKGKMQRLSLSVGVKKKKNKKKNKKALNNTI